MEKKEEIKENVSSLFFIGIENVETGNGTANYNSQSAHNFFQIMEQEK